jgi:acetyl-CoA carboxylase carboxyltransferase component
VAWPTAEISVMGAEGMIGILSKKLFGDEKPSDEFKKDLVREIGSRIDVYRVAGWGLVDEVIDPRDTRRAIAWGLELAKNKKVEGPRRRRSIIPV